MARIILTVCGSFHASSANRAALDRANEALQALSDLRVQDAVPLDRLPALNPGLFDSPPEAVSQFRAQVDEAQGIILAAPNMRVVSQEASRTPSIGAWDRAASTESP
jgi:NAD(P)H-dependent FMN reductase